LRVKSLGAETFGYTFGHPEGDLVIGHRDSACLPKCVVITPISTGPTMNSQPDRLHTSIIYEVHVKGFSLLNPAVPAQFARHLRRLGCQPRLTISGA